MPALDGLRALAVLAVIWYHAGALDGGWIGVELFFVLSGYLITALLLAERDATGAIDLRDFWTRRARRLLPAIGLLVVLVAIYAGLYRDTRPSRSIDADLLGLLTYTSNWTTLGGDGYWQQFDAPSPLRHAWSLAVEEQFYLVFPLIAAVVLGRRHRVAILGGLAACALTWQVAAPAWLSVERVYLGTDTRAFGLLAGAALAAVAAARPMPRPPLAGLGLATLVILTVVLGPATAATFRGPFQLVVAASLVILVDVTGERRSTTNRALSVGPLVAVGRWSYGIYLFHWPILLMLADPLGDRPVLLGLAVGLVTIPLAGLSYLWIEEPIRSGRLGDGSGVGRRLATVSAGAVVVALAIGAATTAVDDPPTAAAVAQREITVNAPPTPPASTTTTTPTGSTTTDSNPSATSTTLSRDRTTTTTTPRRPSSPSSTAASTSTSPPTTSTSTSTSTTTTSVPADGGLVDRPEGRPLRIYVAGDSLGHSVGEGLAESADDLGIDVFTRAAGGCGFGRERMQYFDGEFEPEACRDLVEAWRPDVRAYQPDVVIVAYAGWWGWFRDGRIQTQCEPELAEHVRSLYDRLLVDLHASGAPVFMIAPANWEGDPVGPEGIPAMFDCLRDVMRTWVDAHAPAARLVDVAAMLCVDDRCDATIDGEPVRPDRIHFSGPTAPSMMTAILAEVTEPPPGGWIHQRQITLPT